ncbi:MAG: hypothetical protein ABIQ31_12845 [Ferruginibacter sp.]
MIQYILRPEWMKKIQLGICPESIHPENGRAVFVYCDTLTEFHLGKPATKPKYCIEYGSFFPHGKAEISKGVFAVHEGHTDQSTFFGDDMFPDSFQTPEEVFLYSKNKVSELSSKLSETLGNDNLKTNEGIPYNSVKIALAAWKYFTKQFEKALQENSVSLFMNKNPA